MSGNYDNTNRGVLFRNDNKTEDRDPDYRGNINVSGQEFWLDAWINTAKTSGKKFMALRLKPKMAREHQGAPDNPPARQAPQREELDDDIPF